MASSRGKGITFEPVRVRTRWFALLLALLAAVALVLPGLYVYEVYGYSRFEYRVSADGVRARYGFLDLRLPAGEIAAVALVEDPGRLSRVAGTSLPHVQRGWWSSSTLGRVYRLTTTGRSLVLIETTPDAEVARAGTRYLFSPAEPQQFVAMVDAVRRAGTAGAGRGSAPGGDAAGPGLDGAVERSFPPVRAAGGTLAWSPLMLLLLLEVPLVGALVWFIARGRHTLLYRVGPDGIGVRHLFGWHRYAWNRIRDVRRVTNVRAWRVFGAAMPGYYAGTFRGKGLGSLNVYATDLRGETVLIETAGGTRVLISPADVDGFMEAANRHRR